MSNSMDAPPKSIKDRLAQSKPNVGAWLDVKFSIIAEAMVSSWGFHFLVIDMEHGAADVSQSENPVRPRTLRCRPDG